jgi:hypothetical protein
MTPEDITGRKRNIIVASMMVAACLLLIVIIMKPVILGFLAAAAGIIGAGFLLWVSCDRLLDIALEIYDEYKNGY